MIVMLACMWRMSGLHLGAQRVFQLQEEQHGCSEGVGEFCVGMGPDGPCGAHSSLAHMPWENREVRWESGVWQHQLPGEMHKDPCAGTAY